MQLKRYQYKSGNIKILVAGGGDSAIEDRLTDVESVVFQFYK